MKDQLHGCCKDDRPLTLYRLSAAGDPTPLSGSYWHVRCGYRPPSKIQNGILLCDACIARLGLLFLSSFSAADKRHQPTTTTAAR